MRQGLLPGNQFESVQDLKLVLVQKWFKTGEGNTKGDNTNDYPSYAAWISAQNMKWYQGNGLTFFMIGCWH